MMLLGGCRHTCGAAASAWNCMRRAPPLVLLLAGSASLPSPASPRARSRSASLWASTAPPLATSGSVRRCSCSWAAAVRCRAQQGSRGLPPAHGLGRPSQGAAGRWRHPARRTCLRRCAPPGSASARANPVPSSVAPRSAGRVLRGRQLAAAQPGGQASVPCGPARVLALWPRQRGGAARGPAVWGVCCVRCAPPHAEPCTELRVQSAPLWPVLAHARRPRMACGASMLCPTDPIGRMHADGPPTAPSPPCNAPQGQCAFNAKRGQWECATRVVRHRLATDLVLYSSIWTDSLAITQALQRSNASCAETPAGVCSAYGAPYTFDLQLSITGGMRASFLQQIEWSNGLRGLLGLPIHRISLMAAEATSHSGVLPTPQRTAAGRGVSRAAWPPAACPCRWRR